MTGITIAAAGAMEWQVSTGKAGRLGGAYRRRSRAAHGRAFGLALGLVLLVPATSALAQDADALSFDQARERLERVSDALAAADANLRARQDLPMRPRACGCRRFRSKRAIWSSRRR